MKKAPVRVTSLLSLLSQSAAGGRPLSSCFNECRRTHFLARSLVLPLTHSYTRRMGSADVVVDVVDGRSGGGKVGFADCGRGKFGV